jgi:hypothetical protein
MYISNFVNAGPASSNVRRHVSRDFTLKLGLALYGILKNGKATKFIFLDSEIREKGVVAFESLLALNGIINFVRI